MLFRLRALGKGKESILFPGRKVHLHAMITSCGHQVERNPTYDWHGLKRGTAPLALFQYTLSGKGLLTYQGKDMHVPPGHAMILHFPFDNRYRLPKGWKPWEFIFICLNGSEALRIWEIIEHRVGPLVQLPETSSSVSTATRIYEMARRDSIHTPFDASSLAYQLCMTLSRELLYERRVSQRPICVTKAMAFCSQHLSQPIGVDDMAAACGYSRFHFTRIFQSSEGVAPGEYLIGCRITEASKLLSSTNLSIKEIARQCGFQDGNYFCKAFRKRIGVSPGAFRKSGMY